MKLAGAITILLLALLAGCATKETVAPKPAPVPAPAPGRAKPPTEAQPEIYSRLAGRKIKPIAVKPINVKADCSFRDPDGYGGKLNLLVEDSQVRRLQAEVQVPRRGNCAFALKDFRQTANEPAVTLSAASGQCTVRLWEQEGRVTVAFNSCKDRCGGDSFDYVWPILVDASTGTCS
ncbi:MAG TPA: hypothetical protein VFF82_08290 [Rhodocyclaceae bacterium]|nr:hypothetical protein [Rhodocyclaceae bacterium]